MTRHKMIWAAAAGLGLMIIVLACNKQVTGFLSDRLYYLQNPFFVQQGVTTVSSTLVADGSTPPLKVNLLAITNKATGASVDSLFLKPQNIAIFNSPVTDQDTTLDQLNAKIKDSLVAPFILNGLGGRLEFTGSSRYIDTGTYSLDISVSNVRGMKTLKDACDIIITPSSPDSILYLAWSSIDGTGTAVGLPGAPVVTITHHPEGPAKIIMKWRDKNGVLFNPAAGEVAARTGRPNFGFWDPYYAEERTDTALVYQYPTSMSQLPLFLTSTRYSGYTNGISYYQIPLAHTDIGQGIGTTSTIEYFNPAGTYEVTFFLSNVTRVP